MERRGVLPTSRNCRPSLKSAVLFVGFWLGCGCVDLWGCQLDDPAALSGFDSGEVFDVQDDQVLQPDNEFLIRLLFRASKASQQSMEKFARYTDGADIEKLAAAAREFRFQVFRIRGRAKRVTPVKIPSLEEDSEFRGSYLVHVVTENQRSIVVALPGSEQVSVPGQKRQRLPPVPLSWPTRKEIDQPCTIVGFFLARHVFPNAPGNGDAILADQLGLTDENALVFVAKRLAWHPDKQDDEFGVGADHLLLAKHGVDLGQFDFVRANGNRSISKKEATVFYQMLAASTAIEVDVVGDSQLGFQNLLQSPSKYYGHSLTIDGYVRRAVKIKVADDPVAARNGLDHYYELDMFVPLGDNLVVVRTKTTESKTGHENSNPGPESSASPVKSSADQLVYEDRFPLTVCVTKLPVEASSLEKKRIRLKGFFLKLWNYESRFTEQFNSQTGQVSPLVIGLEPQIVESSSQGFQWLLVAFAGLLGAMILFYFLIVSRDRPAPRLAEKPEHVDLSGIE